MVERDGARPEREREEREREQAREGKPGHTRRGEAKHQQHKCELHQKKKKRKRKDSTGTCRECDGRSMIRNSRREIDTCQQRHTDTSKPEKREK